jgi:hypothetical protein
VRTDTLRIRAVAAAVLVFAVAPATAPAKSPLEVSVQDDATLVLGRWGSPDVVLDAARRFRARWVRVNMGWARITPTADDPQPPDDPRYDFSEYDRLVKQAKRRNMQVAITITGPAPAWATADGRRGVLRPDPVRYGRFVRTVVKHFRDRGVRRYSLWNEPNWHNMLQPYETCPPGVPAGSPLCEPTSALVYRELYRAGYAAVQSADPDAQVLLGELAPDDRPGRSVGPLRWLRTMLCLDARGVRVRSCRGLVADGLALHPYQFAVAPDRDGSPTPDSVQIGGIDRAAAALDRFARVQPQPGGGRPDAPLTTPARRPLDLFLTEYAYVTTGSRRQTPETRAAWLTGSFTLAAKHPRVRQLSQYMVLDAPSWYRGWRSAILTADGAPTPAFSALVDWAAQARAIGWIR